MTVSSTPLLVPGGAPEETFPAADVCSASLIPAKWIDTLMVMGMTMLKRMKIMMEMMMIMMMITTMKMEGGVTTIAMGMIMMMSVDDDDGGRS